LTVTLAWLSPVHPTTQKYRGANLWFTVPNLALTPERQDCDWQEVRRGTIHHEVFDGDKAYIISDGDSLSIKVNCRADAARLAAQVPYGLVVSLEVAEGISIPIYQEIREHIRQSIDLQTGS
jgi:hypothetical protein